MFVHHPTKVEDWKSRNRSAVQAVSGCRGWAPRAGRAARDILCNCAAGLGTKVEGPRPPVRVTIIESGTWFPDDTVTRYRHSESGTDRVLGSR